MSAVSMLISESDWMLSLCVGSACNSVFLILVVFPVGATCNWCLARHFKDELLPTHTPGIRLPNCAAKASNVRLPADFMERLGTAQLNQN